ncbi:FKBP-type peptidyl-prolyl cis-trans isomerase [Williamsia maris]|uniref:FKBP-type peptidyl-prolyl cis-trans isomerase n=1 Tax=Williamsia maris TaxID=72806 RepID=UPI0027E2A0FA|nr:FKBP-type peptidyl-prolyl cis-trans isomerase [Williamsia maris]
MRRSLKISSSVLALCVAVSVAAACGDSDSSDASSSSAATTTTAAADTTDTAAAETTTPAAAPPSSGTSGSAGIPAITANGTDLTKEPTIAAGGATPPTGLAIADLVAGEGKTAVASDTVNVRYTGVLYSDGSKFDASWKAGSEPVEFPLSGVVPGFAEGIVGMKIGGRREIVIPPALGYGDETSGPIPGGSTLVFVVDLVSIS